jgi:hypothetical protein
MHRSVAAFISTFVFYWFCPSICSQLMVFLTFKSSNNYS